MSRCPMYCMIGAGMTHPNPALDAALRAGWAGACGLYEHLAAGRPLAPMPFDAIRLNPGEQRYGDTVLGYARYYGMNVTYNQSSSLWFGSPVFVLAGLAATSIGNHATRQRAERMAAAQWRDHASVRTVVTDKRFMCDYMGNWLSFWHEGVVEISIDVPRWAFIVRYEVGEPLLLHGPAAPWFALAGAHLVYGPRGHQLPAFNGIAQAVADRRRKLITPPPPSPPNTGSPTPNET
jgi:hypothetical protein